MTGHRTGLPAPPITIRNRTSDAQGPPDPRPHPPCACAKGAFHSKALNTLHKAGRIALPASRRGGGAPTPQRFDAPVAAATAVPGTVEAVAGLSLERVEQGRQRRVWNTLLHFEHPQGTTTFAGCQVRYLVVSAAWTGNEFGGAPLGDQRLSARLVKSAGLLASLPGEAVTANASHDRAAVKGYYRLIDQPVSSAVTPGNILAPHRARTLQRMRGQDTVLWCARLTGEGQPVKVRRKEGITNHLHPESCAGRCEAAGEALTGARTGRAIEHRKRERLERLDCHSGRRQHRHHRHGEGMEGATVSKNPCTFVRPSSGPGRSSFCPGSRTGAAAGRRIPYPMMHGMKKSDEAIVPVKAANKGAQTPAESPEGRASTKGNLRDQSTHRTQGRDGVSQAVERIRQAATPRGLPSTTQGRSRMR